MQIALLGAVYHLLRPFGQSPGRRLGMAVVVAVLLLPVLQATLIWTAESLVRSPWYVVLLLVLAATGGFYLGASVTSRRHRR